MDTQKNGSLATDGRALVSTHEAQITTVDMFDQGRAKSALMVASSLAASSLIPEHYQHRPENVLVAMYRAARLGVDVFAYMETTYSVHGRLGHESKFIISLINTCGKFKTPLLYELTGEIIRDKAGRITGQSTRKCKAYAILKDTGTEISQEVDIQLAISEGWIKNQKWHTMTDVMLQYRAASFFGKMYCPEMVMGLNTRDELEDISDAEVIEETQTGKDIFEKGEPVDTAPDPVLDPAKEIKQGAAQTVAPEAAALPDASAQPSMSAEELSQENPPEDIGTFRAWFLKKFESEGTTVDVFLLSKKWLTMGETAIDLTDSKFKNLRAQWEKFVSAYTAFKVSRKAGAA